MVLSDIFANLGYFGPFTLLIVISITMLLQQYHLDMILLLFVMQSINLVLNYIIKNLLQQKRPSNQTSINFLDQEDSVQYGMPSGHAQQMLSLLVFATFEIGKNVLTLFAFFQTVVTLWQRYSYKKHTLNKLIVGGVIGSFIGMIFLRYKYFIFHAL